jgi:translation elongation factor aEF-1 beta
MGEIMCQFDLKGESPDTDLNKVVEDIRSSIAEVDERIKIQNNHEIKPLFFGIKAAVLQFVIPEEDGIQDKLEEWLMDKDGISEIELSFTTRL